MAGDASEPASVAAETDFSGDSAAGFSFLGDSAAGFSFLGDSLASSVAAGKASTAAASLTSSFGVSDLTVVSSGSASSSSAFSAFLLAGRDREVDAAATFFDFGGGLGAAADLGGLPTAPRAGAFLVGADFFAAALVGVFLAAAFPAP